MSKHTPPGLRDMMDDMDDMDESPDDPNRRELEDCLSREYLEHSSVGTGSIDADDVIAHALVEISENLNRANGLAERQNAILERMAEALESTLTDTPTGRQGFGVIQFDASGRMRSWD